VGLCLGLFLAMYIICFFGFFHLPICPFIECPIFLFLIIFVKGQIDYHLEEFAMVILLA
jgi:hypothetical protein